ADAADAAVLPGRGAKMSSAGMAGITAVGDSGSSFFSSPALPASLASARSAGRWSAGRWGSPSELGSSAAVAAGSGSTAALNVSSLSGLSSGFALPLPLLLARVPLLEADLVVLLPAVLRVGGLRVAVRFGAGVGAGVGTSAARVA